MLPDARLAVIAQVQQAVTTLLTTREPAFLAIGHNLFMAFAVIVLAWQGIQMMFSSHPLQDSLFEFAKLLLGVAFGYTMIAYYESPIPGLGLSFSNLITDHTAYLARILDARSVEQTYGHLDQLWGKFLTPDVWSLLASLVYWMLLLVIMLAKAATLAVVAYGLIASAVCALVGPLFVPFFILPKFDWLFWGWLKAFLQYSFFPVIAFAYLMVGEHFVGAYVSTVPNGIAEDLYLVYGVQAAVVMVTFFVGIISIPMLTSAIFSGYAYSGAGVLGLLPRSMTAAAAGRAARGRS